MSLESKFEIWSQIFLRTKCVKFLQENEKKSVKKLEQVISCTAPLVKIYARRSEKIQAWFNSEDMPCLDPFLENYERLLFLKIKFLNKFSEEIIQEN